MVLDQSSRRVDTPGMSSRSLLLLPSRVFQTYLLLSLWLFVFGPGVWKVADPLFVCIYALLGQAAILVGYTLGIARPAAQLLYRRFAWNTVNAAFYVFVAVTLVGLFTRHDTATSVVEAVLDPNLAYSLHGAAILERRETSAVVVISALCGPLLALAMANGMTFWRRLDWRQRTLWAVGVGLHITNGFLTGTAKNLFDVALLIPLLSRAQRAVPNTTLHHGNGVIASPQRSLVRNIAVPLVSAAVLAGAMWYFYHSRLARYAGQFPSGSVGWSTDLWGVALPGPVEYGLATVCGYLCQGYYGLAGCLDLPFVWSWGVGHSSVLSRYAGALCSDADAFRDLTYPVRYEAVSGYRCGHQWHTIYPWLASDLTFPGALAFIGFCAWLLARSWRDTVENRNPFAAAFFSQVALLFFFIPMNSSRLAWSEELVAFWSLLVLWQATAGSSAGRGVARG